MTWWWLVMGVLAGVCGGLLLAWSWRVARRWRRWATPAQTLGTGAEAALPRVSLAFLNQVTNTLPDGVVAVTPEGIINYLNRRAASLGGDPQRQWAGEPLLHLLRAPVLHQAVKDCFNTHEAQTLVLEEFTPEHIVLRARLNQVNPTGRDPLVVIILENETELRHLQKVRLDFVHNASHELRTPIAHIVGAVDILESKKGHLPETVRGFVDILKNEAQRLRRLTEDLLVLAKSEQPGTGPTERCDLSAVVHELCHKDWPGSTNRLTCDTPAPLWVGLSHEQAVQVAGNLIENAMKYTQDGEVRVSVQAQDNGALLVVTDTGIGIPQPEQARVFERFYRVDEHRSRESGGTGLGLSIVKNLVEKAGGHVSLKSVVGKGSTFGVWLPGV